MSIIEIKDLKNASPFRPFTLELENGSRIDIPSEGHLFIPPNERFVIVANDHLNIIDPRNISQVLMKK
jgi:hypothetical protein